MAVAISGEALVTAVGHSSRTLQCVVVTPEQAVLDEQADFVAVPMLDGELGVLPGRAPLIGRLGIGELRLRYGTMVKRFFVESGFVQVNANTVTLLTSKAVEATEIDPQAVERQLSSIEESHPTVLADREAADKAEERARAMLRIARKI
ncbi:MAG: ATP synthase F1 subunit epsilon [Gemmataceae bacterium]